MKKTKDEVLMEALGVEAYSRLMKFQKVQLYYAMDEWADIILAQLQQHGVMQAEASAGAVGAAVASGAVAKGVRVCIHSYKAIYLGMGYVRQCTKCGDVQQ